MPQAPYLVYGTIYTSRGKVPNSFVVVGELTTLTNSNGQYAVDLSNFVADDYVIGNSYTIEARDSFNNEYKRETITLTGESLNKDIFLDARSKVNGGTKNHQTRHVENRTAGDEPVTPSNPLSVQTDDRLFTKKMQNDSSGQPIYIGEASPGTPESSAKWRIRKMVYDNGSTKPPTAEIWANGNTEFDKIWDNRTLYDYS